MADDLVRLNVDLIVAPNVTVALIAKRTTPRYQSLQSLRTTVSELASITASQNRVKTLLDWKASLQN
jgi:hypothetical protein